MTKLDFRSDTVTQPTPGMREAMMRAPLGDDVFGDDPSINALQAFAAQMLGFETALFAPSGTQTNLIGLMSHCGRGDEVLVGQQWHTYRWEAGGMAVLGSLQPQPIENQPDGTLRIADLQAAIKPDDPHFAMTRLVVIENTTGGKVLPLQYVESVGTFAKTNHLQLHMDGARLMNAAAALAQADLASPGAIITHEQVAAKARALCQPFDSVSLCLSKGLGAPVGSLLLGTQTLIQKAKRHRKMLGGTMRQAGFLAAAGQYALTHHLARLQEDHSNAEYLANGLARFDFLKVASVATNILFIDVAPEVAERLTTHLRTQQIQFTGTTRLRWVTHLDVNRESVDQALQIIAAFKP